MFLYLTEMPDPPDNENNTSVVAINSEQIASMEKNYSCDGPTTITMVDGREFIVTESITTIKSRLESDNG